MKKTIKKHIEKQEFVKVYIGDDNGNKMTHFNGFIIEQNDKSIMMSDTQDFHYDGIVVLSKVDVYEIKRTENEVVFDTILEKEGIKQYIIEQYTKLNFSLGSIREMLENLRELSLPIIVEGLYNGDKRFQLGSVNKIGKKNLFIDFIDANGNYDFKPTSIKIKEITYFKMDNPYANLFYKYAKRKE